MTHLNHGERANSSLKGWHHGFNNRVDAAHISIWKFLQLLLDKQVLTELEVERLIAGNNGNTRRKRYRDWDGNVYQLLSNYKQGDNILIYLRGIAHNLSI